MTTPLSKEARAALSDGDFAVPGKRKLPLVDKAHVKLAWDMLDRTKDLSDDERIKAAARITRRAKAFGLELSTGEVSLDRGTISIAAMSLDMPVTADHPNKMPFSGVLTRIDEPSDNPPGGSFGKRILVTRAAAEAALPGLLGMSVNFTPWMDGHNVKAKVGVITAAEIVGNALNIEGFIYAADMPAEADLIQLNKDKLGLSFEASKVAVGSMDVDPLVVSSLVFTGAAILLKDKAAYTTTSLAAAADEDHAMNEEIKAMLAEVAGSVSALAGEVKSLKAAADKAEAEKAEAAKAEALKVAAAADADKLAAEKAEAKALADEIAALKTQLADVKAAASKEAAPAVVARKTLSSQENALIIRAGIELPGDGEKLSVAKLDKELANSSLNVQQRLTVKRVLDRAGVI